MVCHMPTLQACLHAYEGGSFSTSCALGGGELDTMPPLKENYELLAFYQEGT